MMHENKEINPIKIYRCMVLNIEMNDRWSMKSCFLLSCKIEMAGGFLLSCKSKLRWLLAVRFKMWQVAVEHDLDSNIVLGLFSIVGDGEGNRFLHYIASLLHPYHRLIERRASLLIDTIWCESNLLFQIFLYINKIYSKFG